MKYIKYIIFACLSLIVVNNVYALSCPNAISKDLGEVASYVKTGVEVIDNSETKTLTIDNNSTTYKIPNYTFNINIYNITDDIYLTVKNDVTDEEETIFASTLDGDVYTIINDDFGQIYNYTITIYSNNAYCYGEKVKTIRYTKPKYNAYSEYTYCKNSSNLYCQKFVTKDLNINGTDDFLNKIKVNNEKNKPEDISEKIIETIKEHWIIYLILFVGIIIGSIAGIFIVRNKKMKDGWKL